MQAQEGVGHQTMQKILVGRKQEQDFLKPAPMLLNKPGVITIGSANVWLLMSSQNKQPPVNVSPIERFIFLRIWCYFEIDSIIQLVI